jgi:hypothetical protein
MRQFVDGDDDFVVAGDVLMLVKAPVSVNGLVDLVCNSYTV